MIEKKKLYIGGEWVSPASQATIDIISPYTEELVGRVPDGCEADMNAAVSAARQALVGPWADYSAEDRAQLIAKLSAAIGARMQEFAEIITLEMGSPATFSLLGQVGASTMALNGFVEHIRNFAFEEERAGALGRTIVRRVPVGVVAGIIPWNVPLFITVLKLGPTLASGSTIVLKPAPETPLDAWLLAEVCEEVGVPAGVVNIVPAGREVGELLVRHPDVDKVAFTGSTAAGRKIGAICGEQLKRVTLELGGKSAGIILDDCDLDASMPMLLPNAIMNNGQACLSQTRILASKRRYDEVVEALAAQVGALKVGDPSDPETAVGPLVAERQRERVEGYLELGRKEGCEVVVGGGRPADQPRGWFVEPTVFRGCDNRMRIAQEEIFGPVLVVIPYEDEADAVRIANDSGYGLSGSVWTQDTEHGIEIARQVRTGSYGVNAFGTMDLQQPFGGFKGSGVGRELGPEGIDAFCEIQTIAIGG